MADARISEIKRIGDRRSPAGSPRSVVKKFFARDADSARFKFPFAVNDLFDARYAGEWAWLHVIKSAETRGISYPTFV